MKKKILFMVINMNVGGTEKALLNMINEIPESDYEITILMLEKYGGFLDSIPGNVKVEYVDGYKEIKDLLNPPPLKVVKGFLRTGRLFKAAGFFTVSLLSKLLNDKILLMKYALRSTPVLKDKYDIAVAYAGPMDLISFFVAKKIKADRKIQWIHFDITKIGFDKNYAAKLYKCFDQIHVVSRVGKEKFLSLLPQMDRKLAVYPNFVSRKSVTAMAEQGRGFEDAFEGYRILTVGRLSKEKGQDLAIQVMSKLKEKGFNVKWYCIGEGNARKEYEQLIRDYGVEKEFILLGSNSNPYPFMKECDIYVQPSRHEGFCITLAEAKCFNKLIVCTDFTGAREQIINNETGLIVDFDAEQTADALVKLLKDEKLRDKIQRNRNTRSETENTADIILFSSTSA
ncbi:glycosyltransferase [Evansella clarkii]|uniref:glycosyltransferase n=1 Tax=Evansella clarkii TaxID=79879 RepID=UPI000B43B04B|nr:glycosyltransferase [Evansella clarkii]